MKRLYEVSPRLVPAHHVIEADTPEDAAAQAADDFAEMMRDTGNVIVRELLTQDEYNNQIMA